MIKKVIKLKSKRRFWAEGYSFSNPISSSSQNACNVWSLHVQFPYLLLPVAIPVVQCWYHWLYTKMDEASGVKRKPTMDMPKTSIIWPSIMVLIGPMQTSSGFGLVFSTQAPPFLFLWLHSQISYQLSIHELVQSFTVLRHKGVSLWPFIDLPIPRNGR